MRRSLLASVVALLVVFLVSINTALAQNDPPLKASTSANAVQALIDQQLADYTSTLTVLAQTAEVQSLDWDTMQVLLTTWQAKALPSAVWFALPDGSYYTVSDGLMDKTLSDRAYFPKLMSGETVCGEVVVSKSTGELSAIVAVPVFVEGEVAGALGMSLMFSGWQEYLGEKLAPAIDEMVVVAGADGALLMRLFSGSTAGSAEGELETMMKGLLEHFPTADEGTVNVETSYSTGKSTWNFACQTSTLTGWTIAIGARKFEPRQQ